MDSFVTPSSLVSTITKSMYAFATVNPTAVPARIKQSGTSASIKSPWQRSKGGIKRLSSQQPKRGPGRPPLKVKVQTQDMHLNLPTDLIDAIDVMKGLRNRKQFILEAIREKLSREASER